MTALSEADWENDASKRSPSRSAGALSTASRSRPGAVSATRGMTC
jgi:hypothetical protein